MAITKVKRWIFDKNTQRSKINRADKLQLNFNKIGIIATISSTDRLAQIKQFKLQKEKEGKLVSCLLHSTMKGADEDECFLDVKGIKWTGEPKCEKTNSFLAESFDILYIATKELSLTLEYIAKTSNATLKVGPYTKEAAPYLDISADTSSENIRTILEEIDLILKKLLNNGK